MKILYIAPSIPNEFSRIRTINLLKSFKHNGCDIDLVSLYSNKNELQYLENLKGIVDDIEIVKQPKMISIFNCLIGLFLPIPLQNSYVNSFKLHRLLSKKSKNYGLVYIKRLRMASYAKHFDSKKVYIDLTDSLTKYYERVMKSSKGISKIINTEEYYKHLKYELKIAKKYNTVICSHADKNYLEKKHNVVLENMKVIYNVIDYDKWYFKYTEKNKNRVKLVFSGVLDYPPNTLAVQFIIKEIMPKLPNNYSITFVGKNVPKELKKYESNRVHFTGYVKDIKAELSKYDIYICPIIAGSGVKNKILQSASVGLPIITNNLGIEGIDEEIKKYVFLANTPNEFIKQIMTVRNMNLKEIIEQQQNFIKDKYDYKNCVKDLIK